MMCWSIPLQFINLNKSSWCAHSTRIFFWFKNCKEKPMLMDTDDNANELNFPGFFFTLTALTICSYLDEHFQEITIKCNLTDCNLIWMLFVIDIVDWNLNLFFTRIFVSLTKSFPWRCSNYRSQRWVSVCVCVCVCVFFIWLFSLSLSSYIIDSG